MKVKALGTNAFVEFDGARVALERRGPWLKDVPARTLYPIEKIIGMNVSTPSTDGGTLQLVVDPRDESLYAPMIVEYPGFRRRDFHALIAAIEDALAGLGRPPYLLAPQLLPNPGAYTQTVARAPAPVPARRVPVVPSPAPSDGGLLDQIERLKAFRDTGVLTAAEFDAAKARLLGLATEPADRAA